MWQAPTGPVVTRFRRYDHMGRLVSGSVFIADASLSTNELAAIHERKVDQEAHDARTFNADGDTSAEPP
jgi:hypothetical protein